MLDHVPAGNARPRGQFRIEHYISSRNCYSCICRRQQGGRRAIYFIIRVSSLLLFDLALPKSTSQSKSLHPTLLSCWRFTDHSTNSLGFAFGPLLWAPISEIWGRRWSMLPAMFCLGLFSLGTATSKNAASIFITRFFGGIFGSAPVSNVSAALGDIWMAQARGIAVTFYAVAVVGGPTLGPVIGSVLVANPQLGWRWTEYVEAVWTFTILG